MIRYLKDIVPKMVRYRLARKGLMTPGNPINLTFSVTNMCQSKCLTCRIWEIYRKNPEKRLEELTTNEIEKMFRSMGHVYVFNVSGGEPFLREDIAEIISLACEYLKPGVIHIPTNALNTDLVKKRTHEILKIIKTNKSSIQLTVKPSLDHIGKKHDAIRGIPGNFRKVMEVFNYLKKLSIQNPNLHAELGTVISKWNVDDVKEIVKFVSDLDSDSYRNEIAEQRSEMFNRDSSITPTPKQYERALRYFVPMIRKHMRDHRFFQRMTHAFRLTYYDLAVRILKEKRQVIPCYAGISNVHISPYGDIWACCTLGYEQTMGNIREHNHDFQDVWNSDRAKSVRTYIRNGNCACPLANQAYSNILLHGPSLSRVTREMIMVNRIVEREDYHWQKTS